MRERCVECSAFRRVGEPCKVCAMPSKGRRQRYTDEQCLESLRDFAVRTGRPPTFNEWKAWRLQPSVQTMFARFGTWGNALTAAGLPAPPRGGESQGLYEQTAVLAARVDRGESLATLGRELGVSGQALGRRVKRWRAMMHEAGLA